jgi:hypothetical protein
MTGRSITSRSKGDRQLRSSSRLRRCCRNAILTVLFVLILRPSLFADEQVIDLSSFTSRISANALPDRWRHLNFSKVNSATSYAVVPDATYGAVIEARSDGAAGALVRSVFIDPRQYPFLTWHWKISKTLPESSLHEKEGDDFPVRLMLSFSNSAKSVAPAAKFEVQDKTLCYVWMANEPIGTRAVNPNYDNVVTIVAADSGEVGSWFGFSRNIVDDYLSAFSEEPGMITGVALMTDSDNTGARVTAWYGPISLHGSAPDN